MGLVAKYIVSEHADLGGSITPQCRGSIVIPHRIGYFLKYAVIYQIIVETGQGRATQGETISALSRIFPFFGG